MGTLEFSVRRRRADCEVNLKIQSTNGVSRKKIMVTGCPENPLIPDGETLQTTHFYNNSLTIFWNISQKVGLLWGFPIGNNGVSWTTVTEFFCG